MTSFKISVSKFIHFILQYEDSDKSCEDQTQCIRHFCWGTVSSVLGFDREGVPKLYENVVYGYTLSGYVLNLRPAVNQDFLQTPDFFSNSPRKFWFQLQFLTCREKIRTSLDLAVSRDSLVPQQ